MPYTRATCAVASASIVGIPPFSGFWSKLIIVIAAVQAQYYTIAAVIVCVSVCTLIMYLKVHRYAFLGEIPESLTQIKEQRGTMLVAMSVLAILCLVMGLLVIVPELRANVLEPAVKVLVDGVDYSVRVIAQKM